MTMTRRITIGIAGCVLFAAVSAPSYQGPSPFKLIVNPKLTGRAVPRDVVAQIFLGKVQRWGDGTIIAPVDLSSTSPVRQAFSEAVLAMPIDGVKRYWMEKVAAGKRPPLTKRTDDDVIAFVAADPGGIGYVSEAATVPDTVRAVEVR
jgi:ABC-type phosphate transport system substrate-binding protein